MSICADTFLLPSTFIINLITISHFWRRRADGAQAKKTVEKYATNLLLISLGDFVCHVLWTAIDVSSFFKSQF